MTSIALWEQVPVRLEEEQLVWNDEVVVREFKTRRRGELAPVALDSDACVPAEMVQYLMYNDVFIHADEAVVRELPVQYELTLLPARPPGRELPKTFGHIHNRLAIGAPTFAEMYEVLYGTAHFLFYAVNASGTRASLCGWVAAEAGQQVVMPPDLYHLTINAGAGPLLFADVISKRARGIYDDVRATHGAPYYELGDSSFRPNPAFAEAAALTAFPQLILPTTTPLYAQFREGALVWLDDPAEFAARFPELKLAV